MLKHTVDTASVTCAVQVATSIGLGGEEDVLTGDQINTLYQKMGLKEQSQLQLCYDAKLHGHHSRNMHARCDNKGKTFTLMRRNANGRVFGGFTHINMQHGMSWVRGNPVGPWLFSVNPKTKKIEFNVKYSRSNYVYYMNNDYHMTWGGGHDLYCNRDLNNCNANIGHDYNTNGRGYHTSGAKVYLTGSYTWNHREGGGHGMVYEVYYLK